MDNPMSNLHFKFMSLSFALRDFFRSPNSILKETNIKHGFHILDYGCGPGSYSLAAGKLVGESGKVYALDIHPFAVRSVQKRASKKGITNIETISSDCTTGLKNDSIDIVLLYDTFHDLGEPDRILEELHRVLKPNSIISFTDHHLNEDEIISRIAKSGLFKFLKKGKLTYSFIKEC